MSQFPICTYLHDDGHQCRSAAVRGRQFCLYHLRHRGRLMRMAQSRSLNQRFQLFLPPPEDPAAIHSALTQVIEALAADAIEPSRARALISGLRLCLQSLKKKDSWHDSAYHCDEPVEYDNFEAEYGLPKDIDITVAPEVAFPPNPDLSSRASAASEGSAVSLSSRADPERSRGANEGPAFLPDPDIAAEAQHIIDVSRGLPSTPEDFLRFGSCVTPLDAELMEVTRTHGFDAAQKIQDQFERNEHRRVHRRQSSADRERFALISMQRNLQAAIERRAAILAAERAAQHEEKVGCPTLTRLAGVSEAGASWRDPEQGAERRAEGPVFGGVGSSTLAPKKPAGSEIQPSREALENAQLTPTGSIG